MIGMVLAAGAGVRLLPLTDALPKTLLPVDGDRSILDITLANLKHVGLERVVVVTGFASERIEERLPELERRHGVRLETVFNPKAEVWNNAYSLWCARDHFRAGVLLVNGDTLTPPEVQRRLLEGRGEPVVIALDDQKRLGEEEMKVVVSPDGRLERIHKQLDPGAAHGEYMGLTLIEPAAAEGLAEALEATWRRDPQLYYEDGFQEYANRGGHVGIAPIGAIEWVEIDNHDDLSRAREIACRY
ncbi:MAG: phosphocholine cytidylyltransferase family protein [Actinobacteria bacterium]|nr:phosphocholine cytidylyltransferase family protein [Actinomycetota bacterium]